MTIVLFVTTQRKMHLREVIFVTFKIAKLFQVLIS